MRRPAIYLRMLQCTFERRFRSHPGLCERGQRREEGGESTFQGGPTGPKIAKKDTETQLPERFEFRQQHADGQGSFSLLESAIREAYFSGLLVGYN